MLTWKTRRRELQDPSSAARGEELGTKSPRSCFLFGQGSVVRAWPAKCSVAGMEIMGMEDAACVQRACY